MKAENIAEGLLTVILAPVFLLVLLCYVVYSIVTGLMILFYAFTEGFGELWRRRA